LSNDAAGGQLSQPVPSASGIIEKPLVETLKRRKYWTCLSKHGFRGSLTGDLLNPYGPSTINYFCQEPNPAPSRDNLLDRRPWLGLLAQLIYGFRLSVLFGLALTAIGVILCG
jgi:hypothetical protein